MVQHRVTAPRSAGYAVVGGTALQLKERYQPIPLCGVQAWICGLSALSGFLFGYDLCVMVVALPLIQQDFALSATAAQSIVSTLMLGAVIGSLVGGVVADWIGRKPANLITAALFLAGSLFMTFAGSLHSMLVGRFIAGLAVGSSGPCVSTYVAEIAQPKTRGALVTISEKYRTKEASAVLKRLLYSEEASQEIIRAHLDVGTFHESFFHTMSELVTNGLTRKRVLFCVTIAFCHILTAANAMLYYSSYILDGLQVGNAHQVSPLSKEIWVGIAKLAGVCSAVAVVDRVGRRPLLIIGTSTMLICHFTIGEWNLYVFIFAWNLSWAPLMWVVCSEMLPDEFRSIGMGLTFGTFWLGSALVNQTLLSVFHAFGTGNAFLLYTALTATSLGFVYFKVPETTGLTFEQIAMLFNEQVANLEDGGLPAAQQQLEELECMLSMFPDDEELKIDAAAKAALEDFVTEGNGTDKTPRFDCQIHYTLHYKDLAFGREVPSLTLTCPPGYPEAEPMLFEVKCPQLSRAEMERLNTELVKLTNAACAGREVVGLQQYQLMQEFLTQVQASATVEELQSKAAIVPAEETSTPLTLGRRAIYFHHIIASNKRRVVKEWASELQLGGFSKIGWPGVVIVEGPEPNVQEYVRRLQHLRWKQITVRGEQTEELTEGSSGDIDSLRRLPHSFYEFPENGMSDLATACRDAGLEELFLTTMKIYGRSEDKENLGKNKGKHTGQKSEK
ncbi:hypothetical protein JG688_00000064 [Phytophthora aleatoria]|uniref:Major facilitator superfamily (MFS) profile domain-containing protein n=1 Tax=Phytophthora aleatoria TaxID=2496075 RepID=A0A8J5J5E4_9STRA|nr:hypothetical protein JG688_00000064 [Phytophthora aleatoria]